MATSGKNIKSGFNLNPETEKMISGSAIVWPKAKEEIWPELWDKAQKLKSVDVNRRKAYIVLIRYAAAASITLLAGLIFAMYFYTKTIDTLHNTHSEIILPDKSVVSLSEQSLLSYKPLFWNISRKVTLHGEGIFTVQKGSRFDVVSEKGKASVLGTRFNVYSRSDDYVVSCFSGKVKVVGFARHNEVIIAGGQKAILKTDGAFLIVDIEKEMIQMRDQSKHKNFDAELDAVLSDTKNDILPSVTDNNNIDAEEHSGVETEKPADDKSVKNSGIVSGGSEESVSENALPAVSEPEVKEDKEKEQTESEVKSNPVATNAASGDRFRNSLTKEQIDILEDQTMSREEKKKAFMESLSPGQLKMLEEQTKERARQTAKDKADSKEKEELKNQQKMQLQDQIRSGKENTEQRNRRNNEDSKPSGNNGAGSGRENNQGNGN